LQLNGQSRGILPGFFSSIYRPQFPLYAGWIADWGGSSGQILITIEIRPLRTLSQPLSLTRDYLSLDLSLAIVNGFHSRRKLPRLHSRIETTTVTSIIFSAVAINQAAVQ
jgi:hypothetical protein